MVKNFKWLKEKHVFYQPWKLVIHIIFALCIYLADRKADNYMLYHQKQKSLYFMFNTLRNITDIPWNLPWAVVYQEKIKGDMKYNI